MFSLLSGGYGTNKITGEISIDILKLLITNNPNKSEIEEMRRLVRGCGDYNNIKIALPCIKPHGSFVGTGKTENLKSFSGYIYFDIDNCDTEATMTNILKKHSDKIFMMGKSVGGSGLFFT